MAPCSQSTHDAGQLACRIRTPWPGSGWARSALLYYAADQGPARHTVTAPDLFPLPVMQELQTKDGGDLTVA